MQSENNDKICLALHLAKVTFLLWAPKSKPSKSVAYSLDIFLIIMILKRLADWMNGKIKVKFICSLFYYHIFVTWLNIILR